MHLDHLPFVMLDPFRSRRQIQMPTPAQLCELESAVLESLSKLEDEHAWEVVDDWPDDCRMFLVVD